MGRRFARVAIIGLLGVATVAFGTTEKRVTVRVDGVPVSVRTHAATVQDALVRAGIDLGKLDRVEPSLEAGISSGDVIEILRAKPVILLLDGRPRRVMVTGLTIAEVIDEIQVRRTAIDAVHPGPRTPIRPGMTISYRRAVGLDVVADGTTDRVITTARSVRQVLDELGVDLGQSDRVEPGLDVRPAQDMRVRVLRVGYRREAVTRTIDFDTILRRDSGMEYGQRKVLQEGREGRRRLVYRNKYVDGERVAHTLIRSEWIRRPRDRIIAIGSGYPGCACTRGTQTGKATWYHRDDGLTAAHRTLPMGTIVRVENLANGKWVNVRIVDRGPFGDGRIIDLSDDAFRRIASLSQGVISVRIRW